jgi:hypothetical protein
MDKVRRLALALVVVAGAAPACGGAAPAPRGNISFVDGTRLKAIHYEIDGAPPYFLGWFDSALGVTCKFVPRDVPDQLVCLPSDTVEPLFVSSTAFFADSGCTTPVVGTNSPAAARYFLRWPDATDGCDATPPRLFHVGAPVTTPASVYTMDPSTGACRAADPAVVNREYVALHVLGPEIPIDTLVSGTFRHDGGPGRIVPLTIVGDDGSTQGANVNLDEVVAWDNQRREVVWAPTFPASDSRWSPVLAYDARYFADAACTEPAALGAACRGVAKAAFIPSDDVDACGRSRPATLLDLGPPLGEGARIYDAGAGNACLQNEDWPVTDPDYAAFSVGSVIPPASLAAVAEVRAGDAQLQVVQVGGPGGAGVGTTGLFDTVHGWPCAASIAGDGATRCLPSAFDLTWSILFADAACSVPLVVGLPPDSPCSPRPTLAAITDPIAGTRQIFPIGDAYTGMIYAGIPQACSFAGDNTNGGWGEVYATRPQLPADAFAPLKLARAD